MNQHDHYKVVCKYCDAVMQQCRCPAPDKTIAAGVCEKCLKKPLGEVLEVVKTK